MSLQKKIVSLQQLQRLVRTYKKDGAVVGCLSGSFDVLTGRHYKALHACASQCDMLIVLLNSDASVRAYKGLSKPYMYQDERAYIVAQSPYVHHVAIFDSATPVPVLEKLKPNIFFNTAGWGAECIEKAVIERNGGKIVAFDVQLNSNWMRSTSELVSKMISVEKNKSRSVIFLDRDGVINENGAGYIHTWEDFRFIAGVVPALKRLVKAGYPLFIITNQSGIGRGMYSERQLNTLHNKVRAYLREHGIHISGIYYCPHHPEQNCTCRKPSPEMLLCAVREHNINLSKSWFIGDSQADVGAGRQANVQTILIGNDAGGDYKPNYYVASLRQAVDLILKT